MINPRCVIAVPLQLRCRRKIFLCLKQKDRKFSYVFLDGTAFNSEREYGSNLGYQVEEIAVKAFRFSPNAKE